MKPLVSIIIPVYNVENYLDYCLKSVMEQRYDNLEIILVNDGSTDNSGEICDFYASKDVRIKVIHKENGGLSSARNAGMKIMTGQYFSFIDSDDYVRKDYISKMLFCIQKDNTDIVVCSAKKVIGEEQEHEFIETRARHDVYERDMVKYKMLGREIPMYAHGKLYRADLSEYINFPEGRLYEDIPTTWNVIKYINSITYLQEKLYYYRQRPDSIVNTKFKTRRMDAVYFMEAIVDEIPEDDPLYVRAVSRCFFCVADNYSLITKEFAKEKQYLKECIKKYRKYVLKDEKKQNSLKIMAVVSYISPEIIRVFGKAYKKYNYLKWFCKSIG